MNTKESVEGDKDAAEPRGTTQRVTNIDDLRTHHPALWDVYCELIYLKHDHVAKSHKRELEAPVQNSKKRKCDASHVRSASDDDSQLL